MASDPQTLFSQSRTYYMLIRIIDLEFSSMRETSHELKKFIGTLKSSHPFLYNGIIAYHHQKLGLPGLEEDDYHKLVASLCKAGNIESLSSIISSPESIKMPSYWFGIALTIFAPRWAALMDNDHMHKTRLCEVQNVIALIDANESSFKEEHGNLGFGSERDMAMNLLTFAIAHKADAYIAINGKLSPQIRKEFKRFIIQEQFDKPLWRKALENNERMSSKMMVDLTPVTVVGSCFLREMKD